MMSRSETIESTRATVDGLLAEMGIPEVSSDSVLVAPSSPPDGAVLLENVDRFHHFVFRFALAVRFVGYPIDEVAGLTVEQFCEMYVSESYPEIPTEPLSEDQYEFGRDRESRPPAGETNEFPICFVLGVGRSGTTLLRTMLNVHPELWAPGELHLAHYEGMADRAANIIPALRYMPVPEIATRLGESVESFSETFRGWESSDLSISRVYETLYEADPGTLIVDKTPTYSDSLAGLQRIGRQFPNARFVHLVRSPHDVIQSLVRMQLYKGLADRVAPGLNPYHMAEVAWFAHNSNIEAFLTTVPSDRQTRVRYEEVVSDPEEPLRRICAVLARSYDPKMADPYEQSGRRIALGAGDPTVNALRRVEKRTPRDAFYPLGTRSRNLARGHGY